MLTMLLAAAALANAPAAHSSKPAYSAEVVTTLDGKTSTRKVYSDGVRTKSEVFDPKAKGPGGSYSDDSKGFYWIYDPSFGCIQMPMKPPDEMKVKRSEELLGNETIDGHPTKKFKVTESGVINGKSITDVDIVWRATDLGDIVIQRRGADGKSEMKMRSIVLGVPDASLLAMPPGCKYDEMKDTTRYAAGAPGGFRDVRFSDASCKQLVPLELSLSIPSDYAIRGTKMGCFWGSTADLDRVITSNETADFTGIERGVFWCRISESTEYDPGRKRFVSEDGTDDEWPSALRRMGAKDVSIKRTTVGDWPALTLSASMKGTPAYMLYIGVFDSPAILINYHPPAKASADDAAVWAHFISSIRKSAN